MGEKEKKLKISINEFYSIDLIMVIVDGFETEIWVMSISLTVQSNVLSPDKKATRGCLPPQEGRLRVPESFVLLRPFKIFAF